MLKRCLRLTLKLECFAKPLESRWRIGPSFGKGLTCVSGRGELISRQRIRWNPRLWSKLTDTNRFAGSVRSTEICELQYKGAWMTGEMTRRDDGGIVLTFPATNASGYPGRSI